MPILDQHPKDDSMLQMLSGIHYRLDPNADIAKDVLQIILEHDPEHAYADKRW